MVQNIYCGSGHWAVRHFLSKKKSNCTKWFFFHLKPNKSLESPDFGTPVIQLWARLVWPGRYLRVSGPARQGQHPHQAGFSRILTCGCRLSMVWFSNLMNQVHTQTEPQVQVHSSCFTQTWTQNWVQVHVDIAPWTLVWTVVHLVHWLLFSADAEDNWSDLWSLL